MRIGFHIALQTTALVSGAAALTLVIEAQSTAALTAREQVQGDSRDLESFERFASGVGHLLLAGDLVLSGGTTYLAPVAEEQAAGLHSILEALRVSPLFADHQDVCNALDSDLDGLRAAVSTALDFDGEDRDQRLYELLGEFDEHSIELTERVDELRAVLSVAVATRGTLAERRVEQARQRSLLAMLAFVGVILLAWSYLRHALGTPIRRLAEVVRGSRAGAPFISRSGGPTEVQDLAAGFAELVQGLERARAGLEQTVADRTCDLERALEARSAFLANTSHELRTPMNAILGFTDLLVGELADDDRADYLCHIRASGRHLLSLIEDVLDLTKIDAGRMTVEHIAFSPRAVLSEVEAMLASSAVSKGLSYAAVPAPDLPDEVLGDPIRMRQVLVNLVGNAIKFTRAGSIRVECGWDAGRLHAVVEDTGPGIPASRIDAIFESFEQADVSDTRHFGGTGLGLPISRELARLMGGELSVRSEEGVGSTFRVEVSAPRASAVAHEARSAEPLIGPPAGTRILLVDDVAVNRLVGRRLLERMDCVVTEAPDGESAIDAVERARTSGHPFHVILMDLQMPGIDGYEATRLIRARGFPGPIIALSAAVLTESRAQASEAGCVAFLSKPLDVDTLTRTLGEHVTAEELERTPPGGTDLSRTP